MATKQIRCVLASEGPFYEREESFCVTNDGHNGNVVGVVGGIAVSNGGEAETAGDEESGQREVSLDKWRSMASFHFRDAIRDAAQPTGREHDKDTNAATSRRYQQNLLLRDVFESLETPSMYLLQAVRRVDGAHDGSTLFLADLTCLFVWSLEVGFPLGFVANYVMRRKPTLLAPGIHSRRHHTAVRVKWLHNFSLDLAASMFLLYVAWSNWQRRKVRTFRFFMRPDPTKNLRKGVVLLGFVSGMANMLLIVVITYILFRLEAQPHGILLNAVAMDWIGHIDCMLVESFNRQSSLRRYVAASRRQLAVCAQAQLQTNALADIRTLRTSGVFQLLRAAFRRGGITSYCPRPCRRAEGLSSSPHFSPSSSSKPATFPVPLDTLRRDQLWYELILRFFEGLTAYLVFGLWMLTVTGGHVAHTHIVTIIQFFNLTKRKPAKSSLDAEFPIYKLRIRRCTSSDKHRDACYAASAFIHVTLLYIALRLALQYGRRCMPRRYAADVSKNKQESPSPSDASIQSSGKPRSV